MRKSSISSFGNPVRIDVLEPLPRGRPYWPAPRWKNVCSAQPHGWTVVRRAAAGGRGRLGDLRRDRLLRARTPTIDHLVAPQVVLTDRLVVLADEHENGSCSGGAGRRGELWRRRLLRLRGRRGRPDRLGLLTRTGCRIRRASWSPSAEVALSAPATPRPCSLRGPVNMGPARRSRSWWIAGPRSRRCPPPALRRLRAARAGRGRRHAYAGLPTFTAPPSSTARASRSAAPACNAITPASLPRSRTLPRSGSVDLFQLRSSAARRPTCPWR